LPRAPNASLPSPISRAQFATAQQREAAVERALDAEAAAAQESANEAMAAANTAEATAEAANRAFERNVRGR
jgi:hypothetical protein